MWVGKKLLHITIIYKQVHPKPFKINTLNQKIIKICEEKFIYLNYSPRTKDNYLGHIKDFLMSLGINKLYIVTPKTSRPT